MAGWGRWSSLIRDNREGPPKRASTCGRLCVRIVSHFETDGKGDSSTTRLAFPSSSSIRLQPGGRPAEPGRILPGATVVSPSCQLSGRHQAVRQAEEKERERSGRQAGGSGSHPPRVPSTPSQILYHRTGRAAAWRGVYSPPLTPSKSLSTHFRIDIEPGSGYLSSAYDISESTVV